MVRTVGTNPLVTLLAITAFASVLGIAGAILAIPLAAIVQLLLSRFLLGADAQHGEPPAGRGHLSAVRYEVRELIVDLRKLAPLAARSRSDGAGRGRHRGDRPRPRSHAGQAGAPAVKRVALAAAISLATLTVAALLWRFRDAAFLFALSVVAGRRRPTRDRRARAAPRALAGRRAHATSWGWPCSGSSSTSCRAACCASSTTPPIRLSAAYDRLRAAGGASARGFPRLLLGRLPPGGGAVSRHRRRAPHPAARPGAGRSRATPSTSPTRIIVVVALSAYWSASREAFERLWLSLVPAPQRPRARDVWRVGRTRGRLARARRARGERAVRAGAGGDLPAGAPAAADAAGARGRACCAWSRSSACRRPPAPRSWPAAPSASPAGAAAAVVTVRGRRRARPDRRAAGCSPRGVPARR